MSQYSDLMSCVVECERQDGTASDVRYLYDTLLLVRAHRESFLITNRLEIKKLFILVSGGRLTKFRSGPVVFNQGLPAVRPELINSTLDQLITVGTELTPYDWTREFLCIHPGQDYNGRVAWILYNLKNGTIDNPAPLPKFTFN